ncbi:MAG: glycosyltransferase family 2 protein [Phycisphaerales bacterium]|nr:glycosyltransferase family 2 protein [Phycisphaerales bacterium]
MPESSESMPSAMGMPIPPRAEAHPPASVGGVGGVGDVGGVSPTPEPAAPADRMATISPVPLPLPTSDKVFPPGQEPPSILILTKDEEINIEACLKTLTFSDDIVVFDSYSSDRTLELARKFPNVRVIQRKFDTWSKHSNWALEHITWKHQWVYYSDADERVPPELRDEIIRQCNQPGTEVAYRLKYRNMFMERWLRNGGIYPVWIIRLFKPDQIRYEMRDVNPHPVPQGPMGDLQHDFIHYSFNKGLIPWFTKHNSYSTMEGTEAAKVVRTSLWSHIKNLRNPNPVAKRRALKNITFYLPFRGLVRFLYMYFLRKGFLDKDAGFQYALMISMYEYWIEVKIKEIKRRWASRTSDQVRRHMAAHPSTGSAMMPPTAYPKPVGAAGAIPVPGAPEVAGAANAHPVSVLILTKDEEVNIARCLDCLSWSDDVVVYDSFSNDQTVKIAEKYPNVRVVQRKFDNWSSHQNWGVQNIPFKHPWVLYVDADERVPPELAQEVMRFGDPARPESAFRLRRKDMFNGRWLKHAQLYPTWIIRMFRPLKIRYERLVNPVAVVDGQVGEMQEHLIHYPFSKGTVHWFERHNSYSSFETAEILKGRKAGPPLRILDIFNPDPIARRVVLKQVFNRLPLRHAARFVYLYFFRLGILDGPQGFHYSLMMSCYEYWIEVKLKETSRDWRGAGDALAARLLGRGPSPSTQASAPSPAPNPAPSPPDRTPTTPTTPPTPPTPPTPTTPGATEARESAA